MQPSFTTDSSDPLQTPPAATGSTKWKPPIDGAYGARDVANNYDVCRHCGHDFTNLTAFSRHAERHRCPKFRANLPIQDLILGHLRFSIPFTVPIQTCGVRTGPCSVGNLSSSIFWPLIRRMSTHLNRRPRFRAFSTWRITSKPSVNCAFVGRL